MKQTMHNLNLIRRTFIVCLLLMPIETMGQTRIASVSGNWNSTATWGGQSVPTAANDVVINDGINVTVNIANAACKSLTISIGNLTSSVNVGANNLTVSEAVSIYAPTADGASKFITVSTGTFSCGSITMASTTNSTRDIYISITNNGTVNVSGNISMDAPNGHNYILFTGNGTLNIGGNFSGSNGGGITSTTGGGPNGPTTGTVNFNGTGAQTIPAFNFYNLTISGARSTNTITLANTGTIGIAGTFTNSATFTAPGGYYTIGSEINYNGDADQNVITFPYNHLSVSNSNTASVTARVKTLTGNITVNGNLNITGLGATPTVTLQVAANNITVNGTTNVNAFGIFNDNNTTGTNTFVGRVTIANNGQFINTNNPVYEFRGGITNNGTFTKSGTGATTFSTNAQTLSGANVLTFSGGDIIIANPASLTVSTNISFSGTNFTNNSNAAQAFNQTAGTFTFAPNAAQNIGGTGTGTISFFNLTFAGGNTKTANQNFTVKNDLIVSASTTLSFGTAARTISVEGNLSGTGTIAMTGTGLAHTLNLGGSNNTIGGFSTTTGSGSTVNYFRNGDQQIFASSSYQNLIISGSGIKTIQGNVRVLNTLDLRSASISLGTHNLTLASTSSLISSLSGTFSNANMIITEGTGLLIRQAAVNNSTQFVMTYPLGTGSNYTPIRITSFSATFPDGSSLNMRTVGNRAANTNTYDLNRHWEISTTGTFTNIIANVSFTYADPVDVLGDQTKYSLMHSPQIPAVNWAIPASPSAEGANPMSTVGTTTISGTWTARETRKTLYSYQTGSWNSLSTWTTDPSGTLWQGASIPGLGDRVVILNGRTVNVTNNANSVYSLTINEGGILDLASTTGHNFGSISGKGLIRLSAATMPGGTYDNFVAPGGGTVEYYNSAGFTFSQLTYNNLILNLNTPALIALLNSNMTINGNLTIKQGRLQINQDGGGENRNLTIGNDVYVASTGSIRIGTGNFRHRITIGGNFTNDGSVRFTNQTAPNYTTAPTNGMSDVVFNNDHADQNLLCNNTTDFYRIEINKGIDQTYILNIDASAPGNFALYGINNTQNSPPTNDPPSVPNNNALGLLAGTVRLGPNIILPSLSEGPAYNVDVDSRIWIDGANVTFTISGGVGLVVYGTVRISTSGNLNISNGNQGFIMREQSLFIMESGTMTTPTIRTSAIAGTHRGEFNMSGGTINITGNTNIAAYASFTLPYPDNVFRMSGGTINILNPNITNTNPGNNFSILLGMNSNNAIITGGTINITVRTDRFSYINSTAPFWNLNITGTLAAQRAQIVAYAGSATPSIPAIPAQPLVVLNDFSIQNSAYFDVTNPTPNANVTVGGNFTIQTGATYLPGTNTTTFNGLGTQNFIVNGTIQEDLNHLLLTGATDLTLYGKNIVVKGDLSIGSGCMLRDNGRTVTVRGNITNSGTHFRPVSGAGSIILDGTNAQILSGDGNGIFNNLTLNKSGGSTTTSANFTITGELRLANTAARLNIGNNKLHITETGDIFDNLTGTGKSFNNSRMIVTNGMSSAGGVSKVYTGTSPFIFPVGIQVGATFYYTPGSIQFTSAPATYGTVTTRPVNGRHPLATGTNNALTMYWKTTSSGFSGVSPGSVVHSYFYDAAGSNFFVIGTEANYIPAVLLNGITWNYIDNTALVIDGTNEIRYPTANAADGEFTAGLISAFGTIPVLYSSSTPGNWSSASSWSNTAVGGTGGAGVPTAGTVVVIGDENNAHTITVTANGAVAGSLTINSGSVLDLQTFTGHNFAGIPERGVSGSGTLRISSGTFPSGDFGNFIGPDGGTVEYYTSNANITIPTSSASGLPLTTYRNLRLTHSAAYNITLPNQNLTVYGNLSVTATGTPTGSARLNTTSTRTVTVNGNLIINSGAFEFANVSQVLRVMGNVQVEGGAFRVQNNAGVTHTLEIYGSLIANSTFDMSAGTGYVNVFFKGTNNAVISGSSSIIDFYRLYVDKGNNTIPLLELTTPLTVTPTTGQLVFLQNGTLRVNNAALTISMSAATSNFTIPATACLSVNAGTCRVTYNSGGGSGASKLILEGKLEVLGGRMEIGNPADNTANDIEYASGGTPIIDVKGGILTVAGQVRRPTTVTTGSLNYYQSAGEVNIYGNNAIAGRSKFEVLNSGSLFSLSGGTLNILRAGGTTFGDLYIVPETAIVTGGTIQIGTDLSTANQNFQLFISCPVYNLTIGTPSIGQTARINTYRLRVNNNLTINATSVFLANGLDVTIAGNFTNNNFSVSQGITEGGFRPGSITQTTTFNGINQTISGSGTNLTNFANLVIASTGTVSLNSNTQLRINGNLTLSSGTFATQSNLVFLVGNMVNNSIHTSHLTSGAIHFVGILNQTISGNGQGILGNIVINNTYDVTLKDDLTINGRITFTNGRLYIDDYLLTLGVDAVINNPLGTLGPGRMIMSNGVLSDRGVRKMFKSGETSNYDIPLGVPGKYTLITYSVHQTSLPGSVTVRPVNRAHPALTDAILNNNITYYWSVDSTGFGPDLQITSIYRYLSLDQGDGLNYVVGLYRNNSHRWYNLGNTAPYTVNVSSRVITIATSTFFSGDITAGAPSNFGTVVPLYSRNNRPNNNWFSPTSWTTNPDGSNCVGVGCSGGYYSSFPNGNPTIILAGHTIELDSDGAYAASVKINGELVCGTKVNHNLGKVSGTGKLTLTSTPNGMFVFPGGAFDDFFDTPNTTIELTGNNTSTLPLKPGNFYKPYQNVIFSGTGRKDVTAENLRVKGNMTIMNGTTLYNGTYNKNILIEGNWIDNNTSATGGFIAGTGIVFFNGTLPQLLTITGGSTTEQFYSLTIDNPSGVTINGAGKVMVNKDLYLTRGNITTNLTNLLIISNTSSSAIIGGSASSFVNGPLSKNINNGHSFVFPVGSGTRFGHLSLRNVAATNSPQYWTVTYVNANPHPTYPTAAENLNLPLTGISDNEYWVVNRPAGGSANITLRWDANSYPAITSVANLRSKLRVVEYESASGKWTQRGDIVSGNATSGTVATSVPVTADDFIFTLGIIGVTANIITPPTTYQICEGGEQASISVSLTGNAPWTLNYRTVGNSITRNFTQSGITSSPFTIQLTSVDLGGYGIDPYILSLVSVSDATSSGYVNPSTVSISVKRTFTPSISGPLAVGANETRTYSTPANVGSTYLWSWVGASGGTIASPTSASTNITFNSGTGNFQLRIIENSSSGCSAVALISITVGITPQPDITPKTPNVCQGTTITYSTPYVAGNEYRWNVVNGTCTGCGNFSPNSTISVTWNSTGNASVTVEERIIAQPTIVGTTVQNIYVSSAISPSTISGNQICIGAPGTITVNPTQSAVSYQLKRADDTNLGSPQSGGSNLSFNTGPLFSTSNFYVLAYNEGCQLRIPSAGFVSVTVETPEINLISSDIDNIICQGSEITFTAQNVSTPAVQYNYLLNNTLVQNSTSPTYITSTLAHNDAVMVVGVTANGCRDTSNVVLVSVGNFIWSGGASNAWESIQNWACGVLPTQILDAFIPYRAVRMPTISDNWEVRTLIIEEGATVNHVGGVFSVYGDLINNGTFLSSATVRFAGSAPQTIKGTQNTTLTNVTIDKSADTLFLNRNLSISGHLQLEQGKIRSTPTAMITINHGATSSQGNSNSYVIGPMRKLGNTNFVFPLGDQNQWARLAIWNVTNGNASTAFVASFTHDPSPYPTQIETEIVERKLHHVSEVEHWDLSNPTNDPGISTHLTLYWEDKFRSNITNLTDLRVAHFDGNKWVSHGGVGVSTGALSGYISTTTPLTSFSPISFGSELGENPLPVELIRFRAFLNGSNVVLDWETASEHQNSHFEIQRSVDGGQFIPIGRVNSQARNGHSSQPIQYWFSDANPKLGMNYYRLKQVDFDGKQSYSNLVSVAVDVTLSLFDSIKIYPNPTTNNVFIKIPATNQALTVVLYNSSGSLLLEREYNPNTPYLDLSSLPSGLYLLKIIGAEDYMVSPLIKN